MKDIAHHRHTGLTWLGIAGWGLVFGIVTSAFSMALFKHIDDVYLDLLPKGNIGLATILGALTLAIVWSALLLGLGKCYEWILAKRATSSWPRYFLYAFRFSDGKQIVGWAKITLDISNGILDAIGHSFLLENSKIKKDSCVTWVAGTVSGGTFQNSKVCFILYNLDEDQAELAGRPYRDGLLRFRLLSRKDLKDPKAGPKPTSRGIDQYFGHQQAIDNKESKEWNPAYAEKANIKIETNQEEEEVLTDELAVRAQSLLNAVDVLKTNLKP